MGAEGKPVKIVLLGSSGVGKSNLIARFHSNEFNVEFLSTIGVEFVTKTLNLPGGKSIKLQIWDTAGQERYAKMMRTYYRKAKGALLVYDVTNPCSFEGLETWRKFLKEDADPNCVCIVCGNKVLLLALDMYGGVVGMRYYLVVGIYPWCVYNHKRKTQHLFNNDVDAIVEPSEGEAYADNHDMGFQSTSAKTGDGVSNAFITLAQRINDIQEEENMSTDGDETLRISNCGHQKSSTCC